MTLLESVSAYTESDVELERIREGAAFVVAFMLLLLVLLFVLNLLKWHHIGVAIGLGILITMASTILVLYEKRRRF